MPLTGDQSKNQDKTKNYSLDAQKGPVVGNIHVSGFRDKVDPKKVNAPPFNVVGGSLGVENNTGHSASVSAQHIPNFGNKVTTSTNINMMQNDKHRVDVNAFNTKTMPKGSPNFQTHGGGVNYEFKDKLGANASVARTPAFKTTDYSVGGSMNVHKTPTSSVDLNIGANRRDTAFGRGNWEKNAFIGFKKSF